MLYLAWSGTSSASFGSFHLVRMWQGKGAFLSLMVPLLYVYLTQWAEHRSRRSLLVVIAAGIAATGLTSSAALVVALLVAAVAAAPAPPPRGSWAACRVDRRRHHGL